MLQTFPILRSIALTFISFSSYRVWAADKAKKCKHKAHLAYFLYALVLCADWCTIFLSPTHMDLAAYYYAGIIMLSFNTAIACREIDRLAGLLFSPYILWLTYMAIMHYFLYVNNNNNEWFLNYDGKVNSTTNSMSFLPKLFEFFSNNTSTNDEDILPYH
jgi:benzodiazapine receptor